MTWRRILLFHILAAVLALSATAHGQSCIDPFSAPAANPLRVPQQGLLSEHETARIKQALQSSKPGHERWTEAVDIYLDARVRMFPPELRTSLRKSLNRFRPRFSSHVFEPEMSTKGMSYPRVFEDTPLPYVVMVHEWEHLIRSFAKTGGREMPTGSFNYMLNPVEMYKEEGAAIWAEWELARFVSAKEASEVVAVAKTVSPKRKFISFVETMVGNRGLERQEYLRAVRDSGRYSVLNVVKKTSTNVTLFAVLPPAYVGGFCGFFWWIFH